VICGSDVLAVGALLQARKMGLRVPEDISITGFDDISLAQVTTPSLTTVRVPQHSMGRKAAEVLLDLLNQEPGQNLRHELMTTIIDRGTLARI
jgi:LacI family transcriptional regulator